MSGSEFSMGTSDGIDSIGDSIHVGRNRNGQKDCFAPFEIWFGGAEGDRTPDLMTARHYLRASYYPQYSVT
jgi:hypothetical protein